MLGALPWLHLWGRIVLLGVVLVAVGVITPVLVVVLTMAVMIPVVVAVDGGVVLGSALTRTRRITLLIVAGISMVVPMVV